jgi:hypothetical protein
MVTTLRQPGYCECLETIEIKFWNSLTLTVISPDSCLQSGFVTERVRKKQRLPSLAFV